MTFPVIFKVIQGRMTCCQIEESTQVHTMNNCNYATILLCFRDICSLPAICDKVIRDQTS